MYYKANAFVLLCGIFVDFHGCSAVDLVLTSEKAFNKEKIIKYISVKNFSYLSDHSQFYLVLLSARVLNRKWGTKFRP